MGKELCVYWVFGFVGWFVGCGRWIGCGVVELVEYWCGCCIWFVVCGSWSLVGCGVSGSCDVVGWIGLYWNCVGVMYDCVVGCVGLYLGIGVGEGGGWCIVVSVVSGYWMFDSW